MALTMHSEPNMGGFMCKTAFAMAAAVLVSACVAEPPSVTIDPIYGPRTGDYEEDNGSPAWQAGHLINVMAGKGHLNSDDHQRYEEKVRSATGIGSGPIKDPIDQQVVGAMLGALTNTKGLVVHLKLTAVAFGDHPQKDWHQEDRAHTFGYAGGAQVEAHYCLGDDVAAGVRDPRRADSYSGKDIGASKNTGKWCGDFAGYQQKDQAYGDVRPASTNYAATAVLAMLQNPADAPYWQCVESGDCQLGGCDGTWAMYNGEPYCMPCRAALVLIVPSEGPSCIPE